MSQLGPNFFLASPKLLLASFSTYGSAKKSLILIAASKANPEADRPPLLANTPLAMISNANHNNNLMLSFVVWSKKNWDFMDTSKEKMTKSIGYEIMVGLSMT